MIVIDAEHAFNQPSATIQTQLYPVVVDMRDGRLIETFLAVTVPSQGEAQIEVRIASEPTATTTSERNRIRMTVLEAYEEEVNRQAKREAKRLHNPNRDSNGGR